MSTQVSGLKSVGSSIRYEHSPRPHERVKLTNLLWGVNGRVKVLQEASLSGDFIIDQDLERLVRAEESRSALIFRSLCSHDDPAVNHIMNEAANTHLTIKV